MKEKFLPIGTVVLLKKATKRIMITGYCSAIPEDPNKFYDYVGCLFPEGNLAGEDVALFDHDQIGDIVHMGLCDDEFNTLDEEIKKSFVENNKADQQSIMVFNERLEDLPPMTPDNMKQILEMIKMQEKQSVMQAPTAFSEETMKKPVFTKSSISGDDKKMEKNDKVAISDEFSVEEYEGKGDSVNDGTPVLQLQLIGDDVNNNSTDSSELPILTSVSATEPNVVTTPLPTLTPISDRNSMVGDDVAASVSSLERL